MALVSKRIRCTTAATAAAAPPPTDIGCDVWEYIIKHFLCAHDVSKSLARVCSHRKLRIDWLALMKRDLGFQGVPECGWLPSWALRAAAIDTARGYTINDYRALESLATHATHTMSTNNRAHIDWAWLGEPIVYGDFSFLRNGIAYYFHGFAAKVPVVPSHWYRRACGTRVGIVVYANFTKAAALPS